MFKIDRIVKTLEVSYDSGYRKLLLKVSQNIRKAREARGLSQEDMARFGFNYRHYQKLESGKYSFSLHTLYRVASALRIKVNRLLD